MSLVSSTVVRRRFSKYRILRQLGSGGSGDVYHAVDKFLGRPVALKLLNERRASDADSLRRFILEARSLVRIEHLHVVRVFEIDQHQGQYYIAMELLCGGSGQAVLDQRGALPWAEATRWIADACRGLIAVHQAGLVHRDIKPANLLLAEAGCVKLADFGLVKLHRNQSGMTQPGQVPGTPDFMSPEQCRSEPVDARSDVYSLGATYFALLTGRAPFEGEQPIQVMFAHCSQSPPNPCEEKPAIPAKCAELIARAMAKQPSDRFATADEMLAALEEIVPASPPAPVLAQPKARRWSQRLAMQLAAAALVVAAGGYVAVGYFASGYVTFGGWWKRDDGGQPIEHVVARPIVNVENGDEKSGDERTRQPGPSPEESRFVVIGDKVPRMQIPSPAVMQNLLAYRKRMRELEINGAPLNTLDLGPFQPIVVTADAVKCQGHSDEIADVEFSADGATVASLSADRTLRLWNAATGECLWSVDTPAGRLNALAFNSTTREIASGGVDGTVSFWDAGDGRLVRELALDRGEINALEYAPFGEQLAAACSRGAALISIDFSSKAARAITLDPGPAGVRNRILTCLRFSGDGSTVVAGSMDGRLTMWQVSDEKRVSEDRKGGTPIVAVAVADTPDMYFLSAGQGAIIRTSTDVRAPRTVYYQPGTVSSLDCTGRGELIVFGGSWDGIARMSVAGRRHPYGLDIELQGTIRAMRLSKNGKYVAIGSSAGDLRILEVPSAASLPMPEEPPSATSAVTATTATATAAPARSESER